MPTIDRHPPATSSTTAAILIHRNDTALLVLAGLRLLGRQRLLRLEEAARIGAHVAVLGVRVERLDDRLLQILPARALRELLRDRQRVEARRQRESREHG